MIRMTLGVLVLVTSCRASAVSQETTTAAQAPGSESVTDGGITPGLEAGPAEAHVAEDEGPDDALESLMGTSPGGKSSWQVKVAPSSQDCWQPSDVEQIAWKSKSDEIAIVEEQFGGCDESFIEAASEGDLVKVKAHFAKGKKAKADPDCSGYTGWTPLHVAAMGGHKKVVGYLLGEGASPGPCDYSGQTPLHHAVKQGHFAVARLLLENGAYADPVDLYGDRPIHQVWMGVFEMEPEAVDESTARGMVQDLVEHGAGVSSPDASGQTPLHVAAQEGDLVSVKYLVEHGASLDAKDVHGNMPADVTSSDEVEEYLAQAAAQEP